MIIFTAFCKVWEKYDNFLVIFIMLIYTRENQEKFAIQATSFGGETIYLYLMDPFFSILKFLIRFS